MIRGITIRPVTHENWEAFARFFEAKGSPHYCWCTLHRVCGERKSSNTEKKASMRKLVNAGTPIGLLASKGREPVGWCSVAPRETYVRLERSRAMPRMTSSETPTWTGLCFFVARHCRHQHIANALLEGAVAYARDQGAAVVEGYPLDTAGITATHRGHSRMFKALGFEPRGSAGASASGETTRLNKRSQSDSRALVGAPSALLFDAAAAEP